MSALTILDYSTIEATGKNIQDRIDQKDAQIALLNKQVMTLTGQFQEILSSLSGTDETRSSYDEIEKHLVADHNVQPEVSNLKMLQENQSVRNAQVLLS